jgi:hypothetical protein
MFAQVLTLALLLATSLVVGLGVGIRNEVAATGLEPGRGLM